MNMEISGQLAEDVRYTVPYRVAADFYSYASLFSKLLYLFVCLFVYFLLVNLLLSSLSFRILQ